MALIKSISGIRGTIGGKPGGNLTPPDVVKFISAYGTWLKNTSKEKKSKNKSVVLGRDGRISGAMVESLVAATLSALGIDVINTGLSTTPTVEMAVTALKADGGIIITASHNPKEWNALKLLNAKGEFISGADGEEILKIAAAEDFNFADTLKLGVIRNESGSLAAHIKKVCDHPLVDVKAIKTADFHVTADVINSSGALVLPDLFRALGVEKFEIINEDLSGDFAHNPEPLPENLTSLTKAVLKNGSSFGIAVDPDVDRLALVCEDGSMFGEEYTLVAVADYVLSQTKGNTVSNLSSTRALRDITEKHGGEYFASAVGEVNVVTRMKETKAVIGGEGNGGIIVPELHYGRDALIGIALFLTHLAKSGKSARRLRNSYPDYFISKNKINLDPEVDVNKIFRKLKEKYANRPLNTEDGLKIEFDTDWVHLRTSNTEPVIRIYAESNSETTADHIAQRIIKDIHEASVDTGKQ